ncbi:hypothetical protein, partial [Amantichitinum ursilacus]|uniref:hypothetical protein n=1 Tax=Amantichitinum ursilacus TaxID=857265 RepID=UPI001F1AFD99
GDNAHFGYATVVIKVNCGGRSCMWLWVVGLDPPYEMLAVVEGVVTNQTAVAMRDGSVKRAVSMFTVTRRNHAHPMLRSNEAAILANSRHYLSREGKETGSSGSVRPKFRGAAAESCECKTVRFGF